MKVQNILVLVGTTIIISSVCIIKYIYPIKFNAYALYASIAGTLITSGILYYFLNRKSSTCSASDPGTCHSNIDCNNNGVCDKNNGICACICDEGFSGTHCEIANVLWNSPHCMGPNTQWPARKDKNNMCVCPPGHWTSGTDSKYGYVQCLKCDGNYGPLAGNAPCTYVWNTSNYLTNDCYNQNTDKVCSEFDYLTKYTGPNGEHAYTTPIDLCASSNACRCVSSSSRSVCQVTGYLNPTRKSDTCSNANTSRVCSSYNCK
jgi:hypothetical protein